ncbi:MAG: hypothetical protein I3273_06270 [Candidatus Moeniiplasma glomeromycotorum]|nr:hypothetical protein [Candidatus Moeniiplasma glomeromycotorum]MCE8168022.1 hypothetical protein [Candidatus Moeniiplasma glomeromycotorum]MCE8169690.1 hypothetical protein [Candidatus Moeniiplasma glomeromycotorum]
MNKNNTFLDDMLQGSEPLPEKEKKEEIKKNKLNQSTENDITSQNNPNQLFFDQTLKAHLTETRIKEKLGNISQNWKKEEINELIEDEKKIADYDRLKIKDLPENWKEQLDKIPQLENNQEKHQSQDLKPQDYDQVKQELNEWKQIFIHQTPQEVAQQIKGLEQRPDISQTTWEDYQNRKSSSEFQEVTDKLKEWENTFTDQTPSEAGNERTVLNEREKELKQWEEHFPQQTPKEVKGKIEQLNQRPNISEQDWNNKQEENERLNGELEKANISLKKWEETFSKQGGANEVQQEITNLKKEWAKKDQEYNRAIKELEKWIRVLESQEPEKVKKKITELSQRPNIPISEQQWWDDYSGRKSKEQNNQESQEWQQDKQKIQEYEKEIKDLLEINDLSAWKLELVKLKNSKDGLENKIKMIINLSTTEPLPDDWHNWIISQQQIEIIKNQLEQEKIKLKEWTSQFPQKTPQQVQQENKNDKKNTQSLQNWKDRFENKTAREVEKEIKSKETEITLLQQQIEELGGTVGANPSEKLIEGKLREVVSVEDWNIGYLLQVLKKFQEWREEGTSEQRRAIAKYWLVIKRNIDYLEQRNKKITTIQKTNVRK